MTSLFFLLVLVLYVLIAKIEQPDESLIKKQSLTSLLGWMTSGNWPAKLGAGLLIMGFGALIRYMLLNINLPNEVKLGAGVFISLAFASASWGLRYQRKHRAVQLALAGCSMGVAYLTAYSAFAFFHYLLSMQALMLLAIVACLTGWVAVVEKSLTLSVLAMLGAYIAPGFALETTAPATVLGYYSAISLLAFLMVLARGWRPLIHLSYLFTLGGGLFFGWTQQFYTLVHFHVVQPFLLLLVGQHLIMMIVEPVRQAHRWEINLDQGMFLCLPLTAAALMFGISFDQLHQLALGLAIFGVMWCLAAMLQHWLYKAGSMHYVFVGLVFLSMAVILRLDSVPWFIAGLIATLLFQWLAPRLEIPERLEILIASLAIMFGTFGILHHLLHQSDAPRFLNAALGERLIIGVALIISGRIGSARGQAQGMVARVLGGVWVVGSLLAELVRIDFKYWREVLQCLLILALGIVPFFTRNKPHRPQWLVMLHLGLAANAFVGMLRFTDTEAFWFSLIAWVITLGWVKVEHASTKADQTFIRYGLILAAVQWYPWLGSFWHFNPYYPLLLIVLAAQVSFILAYYWIRENVSAVQSLALIATILVGAIQLFDTTVSIHSAFESTLLDISILFLMTYCVYVIRPTIHHHAETVWINILGLLTLQGWLLKLFGSKSVQTLADLQYLPFPAAISFVWVGFGAILAIAGGKQQLRSRWSAGTLLMVVAAVKLVLFDFGSFGNLGNIFALLLSGAVFMLVAWLVPFPPAKVKVSAPVVPVTPGITVPIAAASIPTSAPEMVAAINTPQNQASATLVPVAEPEPNPPPAAPSGVVSAVESAVPVPPVEQTQGEIPPLNPTKVASESLSQKLRLPSPTDELPLVRELDAGKGFKGLMLLALIATALYVFFPHKKLREYAPEPAKNGNNQTEAAATPQPETVASPQPAEPASAATVAPKVVTACSTFKDKLPATYRLYAVGEYKGKLVGYKEVASGHDMGQEDVYVNMPGSSVVLALGNYDPTVWMIHVTGETSIAGVILSGYHKAFVTGLPADVPVLRQGAQDGSGCGQSFNLQDQRSYADANQAISQLTGRTIEAIYKPYSNRTDIGDLAANSAYTRVDPAAALQFKEAGAGYSGQEGMMLMLQEGVLRTATQSDLQPYSAFFESGNLRGMSLKVYVVNKPVKVPISGLSGLNVLLDPGGQVDSGGGPPGSLTVLQPYPLRCTGMLCGR